MNRRDMESLENSDIVANSTMNRQRGIVGVNSYEKELRLNVVELLECRLQDHGSASWLDLCCGEANALLDVAEHFNSDPLRMRAEAVRLVGVDLVDMFSPRVASRAASPTVIPQLIVASLTSWKPEQTFDLITCVHGLHYIGDKLGLIERAVSWLSESGRFLANIDFQNVRLESEDGKPKRHLFSFRSFLKTLQASEIEFDSGNHLLSANGKCSVNFDMEFIGADDQVGPNYTGQPVVDSWYRHINSRNNGDE